MFDYFLYTFITICFVFPHCLGPWTTPWRQQHRLLLLPTPILLLIAMRSSHSMDPRESIPGETESGLGD
jgi:hypothetical protein